MLVVGRLYTMDDLFEPLRLGVFVAFLELQRFKDGLKARSKDYRRRKIFTTEPHNTKFYKAGTNHRQALTDVPTVRFDEAPPLTNYLLPTTPPYEVSLPEIS